jgi:hypothetical protein
MLSSLVLCGRPWAQLEGQSGNLFANLCLAVIVGPYGEIQLESHLKIIFILVILSIFS